MTGTITLDRLQGLMNNAGIEDREIIAGVELRPLGYQRLAASMGVSIKEVHMLINELITHLRDQGRHVAEDYQRAINEDGRYAMEKDWLKNVTIRDTETGEETFLKGSEAAELLNAIQGGADEQEMLAHYASQPITEDDELEEADESYDSEIESKQGTYNFPWKSGNQHGTGTVVYSDVAKVKLVDVRDSDGDSVSMDSIDVNDLLRQAVAFIGNA